MAAVPGMQVPCWMGVCAAAAWDQSTAVPKAHRTTSASAKDTPMLRHAPTLR
eukprot:CAMPEP_0204151480 /NCGR_PEP_ID=MMETSP0361-20130328/26183_1 /ASSEMBLY_ACC=CAM_ASM_000343 /TAXON_ID=268821 /ORGANISM="Scrippsiella Hangoei, Strain SHTV-5" /LENGTH=51 /DNA_ID=CAMNT_0051106303 /DNA_START=78 /DNA_END=230 /DNA_ORIENTATION=+